MQQREAPLLVEPHALDHRRQQLYAERQVPEQPPSSVRPISAP
jgi:hypothetical protein